LPEAKTQTLRQLLAARVDYASCQQKLAPRNVAQKTRLGDWEADTIIGCNHQEAIVSLTERTSKLTRLAKVVRNTAELVTHAVTTQLQSLIVKTITSDNGREACPSPADWAQAQG
jgi:IS30 family transposase